jgi:hypothetical protein
MFRSGGWTLTLLWVLCFLYFRARERERERDRERGGYKQIIGK